MAKNYFNLPNILTIGRIILSPIFLVILSSPKDISTIILVLIIFIAASITDYYDGVLARKNNIITDLGKILDPIADKILIGFALYSFVKLDMILWWVAVIIFSREVIITIHRFYLLKKGVVIAAIKSGKIKTGVQITMVISLLVYMGLSVLSDTTPYYVFKILKAVVYWIAQISIWLSLFLTIYSGYEYVRNIIIKKAELKKEKKEIYAK